MQILLIDGNAAEQHHRSLLIIDIPGEAQAHPHSWSPNLFWAPMYPQNHFFRQSVTIIIFANIFPK